MIIFISKGHAKSHTFKYSAVGYEREKVTRSQLVEPLEGFTITSQDSTQTAFKLRLQKGVAARWALHFFFLINLGLNFWKRKNGFQGTYLK